MWRWFFSGDAQGIVNGLLAKLGIAPQFFFGPQLVTFTISLLGMYKGVGLIMVYFYAGLKGIPNELYEGILCALRPRAPGRKVVEIQDPGDAIRHGIGFLSEERKKNGPWSPPSSATAIRRRIGSARTSPKAGRWPRI